MDVVATTQRTALPKKALSKATLMSAFDSILRLDVKCGQFICYQCESLDALHLIFLIIDQYGIS